MTYCETVESHYTSVWGPVRERCRWVRGPASELPKDFAVAFFQRSKGSSAYGTVCMSQPSDDVGLELHILTSRSDAAEDEIVEVMTAVAHYHRTGRSLGLGHTVNFGRPVVSGSRCTHGLVSLPYIDGPVLEVLTEPPVRFLWLVPVTQREVEYKKQHGLEALEEQFERNQFNYLDLNRDSVV